MQNAIQFLASGLNFEKPTAPTHQAILITGWESSESICHIGRYLVGLRACAIDAALNIRAVLEDTEEDRVEIVQSVYSVVGESNTKITEPFKQDERNPWIAEGIWHLCMAIAARRNEFHPMGRVILLDYAHIKAKDHGLDVAAIYQTGENTGISLIESKAYRNDPNRAISAAVGFFKEIDEGKHSTRIRQAVQIMRTALTEEANTAISASFWKYNRSYICNPHYHAIQNVDWTNPRPSFRELTPPSSSIAIMPNCVTDFDQFFDNIADEMREFARGL